jgi:hypothetical protein
MFPGQSPVNNVVIAVRPQILLQVANVVGGSWLTSSRFLWVKFQLVDITQAMTEQAMRSTIRNLPKDLGETYSRIMENTRRSPGGTARYETMMKVFRWVAGARRALTIEELEEAVALEKTDTYLHAERSATGAGERLIACCSNLVVYNEGDSTVTFAHQTIQQFLFPSTMTASAPTLGSHFSPQILNEHIAEISLAYLSFSDFGTQLARLPENHSVELGNAEPLVWRNVPFSTPIKGFLSLSRGWRGMAKPTSDHRVKFAIPMASPPAESLMRKYAMLDYIIAFWNIHTADLTPQSAIWPTFRHIACERQLMFDFRPWDDLEHHLRLQQADHHGTYARNRSTMKTMLLCSYAMRHGIRSLLLLRSQDAICDAVCFCMPNSETTEHLTHLLQSLSTMSPSQPSRCGFWSGNLLVYLVQEYDHPPWGLLDFLGEDYSKWKDSGDVRSWCGMLNDAISISSRLDDIMVFERLLGQTRDCKPSEYAAILIAVIREGHVRTHVMRELLYHRVVGDYSIEDLWELSFAFYECFPAVENIMVDIIRPQTVGFPAVPASVTVALLAIILAWGKRPSVLKFLFRSSRALPGLDNPFDLQEFDWATTAFGTAERYTRLRSLHGVNLAASAQQIASLPKHFLELTVYDPSNSGPDVREVTDMLHQLGPLFSAEAFESDGTPCLLWAIERKSYILVETLAPYYTAFLQDEKNWKMSLKIIRSTAMVDLELNVISVYLSGVVWPDFVVSYFVDAFASPSSEFSTIVPPDRRQDWLRKMGLARQPSAT